MFLSGPPSEAHHGKERNTPGEAWVTVGFAAHGHLSGTAEFGPVLGSFSVGSPERLAGSESHCSEPAMSNPEPPLPGSAWGPIGSQGPDAGRATPRVTQLSPARSKVHGFLRCLLRSPHPRWGCLALWVVPGLHTVPGHRAQQLLRHAQGHGADREAARRPVSG